MIFDHHRLLFCLCSWTNFLFSLLKVIIFRRSLVRHILEGGVFLVVELMSSLFGRTDPLEEKSKSRVL